MKREDITALALYSSKNLGKKRKREAMRERGIRETPCDRTTDRSWSDVGQLAQTGTAKHRAVGMATEEHFPPNSASRRQRDKE